VLLPPFTYSLGQELGNIVTTSPLSITGNGVFQEARMKEVILSLKKLRGQASVTDKLQGTGMQRSYCSVSVVLKV